MAVHWGGRGPGHVSRASSIGFSPLSLFAAGEQGFWYDPSDLGTVWQDSARTIPGVVGQPVGCIDDKSGRGNHATQTTTAAKPILRQSGALYYLEFDGTDDFLVTSTITPGVDKAQVFAGVRKNSNAAAAILLEHSADWNANAGTFYMSAPESTSGNYRSASRGNAAVTAGQASETGSLPAPETVVLTATHDIAGDNTTLRRNGTALAAGTADKGTGNFLAYPLYIGRRAGTSLPFNGHIYSLIGRFGSNLDAATITQAETYTNTKTGAY